MNKAKLLQLINFLTEATISNGDYLRGLNFAELRKSQKDTFGNPKEFYQVLQSKAKSGPLFSMETINTIENLPEELSKPETKWLANSIEAEPNANLKQLSSILSWFKATKPNLETLSFREARSKASLWSSSTEHKEPSDKLGKFLTKDVVFRCSNGFSIVKITNEHDLYLEGEIVQNCLRKQERGKRYWNQIKSGESKIYSLRDSENNPHVSMEFQNGKAEQIVGKQNVTPSEKYRPYLEQFLSNGIKHVWNDVSFPYVSIEIFPALAKDEDVNVRIQVAKSPICPTELLLVLSKDASEDVRFQVAKNPKCPIGLLLVLAKDVDINVRLQVIKNPNCPIELLSVLAKDVDKKIRSYVALSPKCPSEILSVLSKDEDWNVRFQVINNQNCTIEVLSALARDKDWRVNAIARSKLEEKPKGNLHELLRYLFV